MKNDLYKLLWGTSVFNYIDENLIDENLETLNNITKENVMSDLLEQLKGKVDSLTIVTIFKGTVVGCGKIKLTYLSHDDDEYNLAEYNLAKKVYHSFQVLKEYVNHIWFNGQGDGFAIRLALSVRLKSNSYVLSISNITEAECNWAAEGRQLA